MRDALDKTFKISNDVCADDANLINSQDVLIIDDTISRGQTIREICNIINDTFVPKSITVLTLFSKKILKLKRSIVLLLFFLSLSNLQNIICLSILSSQIHH